MADAHAGAGAARDESRLILLPVDLDDASVNAVSWAARHVLREGAPAQRPPGARATAAARCSSPAPGRHAPGRHRLRSF